MKGEIFNLFESFVSENWGEDAYEDIYEDVASNLETREPFVGPGTYPDSDFMLLVSKAVEVGQVSMSDAVRAFGKFCFPRLAAKVPDEMARHTHPKSFLKILDNVIHVEVKKVYKDARPPKFTWSEPAPDKLTMIYESPRRMYDLVEGLLEGLSEYYNVPISYERRVSERNGVECCEFSLTFGE